MRETFARQKTRILWNLLSQVEVVENLFSRMGITKSLRGHSKNTYASQGEGGISPSTCPEAHVYCFYDGIGMDLKFVRTF